MRKPGKEPRFDRLALDRRERRQSCAQQLAPLAQLDYVVRIGTRLGQQLPMAAAAALLSGFDAETVDRARTRLVHDTAEYRAVRGVLTRRASPDVMEDVDGELFSSFPVCNESHDQREDDPMSHLVE